MHTFHFWQAAQPTKFWSRTTSCEHGLAGMSAPSQTQSDKIGQNHGHTKQTLARLLSAHCAQAHSRQLFNALLKRYNYSLSFSKRWCIRWWYCWESSSLRVKFGVMVALMPKNIIVVVKIKTWNRRWNVGAQCVIIFGNKKQGTTSSVLMQMWKKFYFLFRVHV